MNVVTASYAVLDLDRQLCFPLYATTRAVTRKYGELLAEVGLTYPQYLVMLALWSRSPQTVGELAEKLQSHHHGTVALVSRCEKLGLVKRRASSEDGRRVEIHLTGKGARLLEQLAKAHRAELDAKPLSASIGSIAR